MLGLRGLTPALGAIAWGYVMIGSLAVALAGRPIVRVLAGLWLASVLLLGAVLVGGEAGLAGSIVLGLGVGTLLFGLWAATGFLLSAVLDQFWPERGSGVSGAR